MSLSMVVCGPVWLSSANTEVWPILECPESFNMGNMRTSLLILNIDRGLAYLGVSGEFENEAYADQTSYPQHKQRSGLLGVTGEFKYGLYADQSGCPQHR